MRWDSRGAAGLAALLFVGAAAPVQAQNAAPQASAEERERARAAYARGQELFEQGSFEEAEAAFLEAYEIVPNPVVWLGVARARESAGRIGAAVAAFERYLEERPEAPDRAQVEQQLEALRSRPGVLVVESVPAGALVTIDGEESEHRTPAEVEVSAGEHRVALTLSGYAPVVETVVVEPGGRHEVAPELAPEGGGAGSAPFGDGVGIAGPEEDGGEVAGDGDAGPSAGVWVATGVTAAGLVAGTVLGFLALNKQSDFDDMPTEELADEGERLALFADVAFGIAAAAAITGIVLYFTGDDGEEAEEVASDATRRARVDLDVAPAVGPRGGGLTARMRF